MPNPVFYLQCKLRIETRGLITSGSGVHIVPSLSFGTALAFDEGRQGGGYWIDPGEGAEGGNNDVILGVRWIYLGPRI